LQALYWSKEDAILDVLEFTKEQREKLNNKNIYLGLDYLYDNKEKIEQKLYKIYSEMQPYQKRRDKSHKSEQDNEIGNFRRREAELLQYSPKRQQASNSNHL